jgi:hypothetical protein
MNPPRSFRRSLLLLEVALAGSLFYPTPVECQATNGIAPPLAAQAPELDRGDRLGRAAGQSGGGGASPVVGSGGGLPNGRG